MRRTRVTVHSGPTGIPLLDIPLWLLGLGGDSGPTEPQWAIPLQPPGYQSEAERREQHALTCEALAMCLECGRHKATRRNRFGERVCANCAPDGEAI